MEAVSEFVRIPVFVPLLVPCAAVADSAVPEASSASGSLATGEGERC